MTIQARIPRRTRQSDPNNRTFWYSLIAHAFILTLLFTTSNSAQPIQLRPSGPQVVQQSTTVNEALLKKEIAAVQAEQSARVNAEKQQVETLRNQQANMQRELQQRQRDLGAEQERLAKLRQVQEQEKQQLAALQQKQAMAQKSFKTQQQALGETEQKLNALRKEQLAVSSAVKKQKLEQQSQALAEQLRQQQLAAEKSALQQQRLQNGIIDRYRAQILAAIQQHWDVPRGITPGMKSTFFVQLAADGAVQQVDLVQSSGSDVLDRSARVALLKASPLPIPADPALNQSLRSIRLVVAPDHYY